MPKEINDLTNKATPVSTDEVEIQETGGGTSKKSTVENLAKGMAVTKDTDTDVKSKSWTVDEDDMTSNLDTKVPTQQSVKKYVDDNTFSGDASDVSVTDTNGNFDSSNVEGVLEEIGDTRHENGFDLQTDSSLPDLAWNDSTRTFTCSVQSGESNFYFWTDGHKHTKTTTQSIVIPDTTDTYYIYFNNSGTIQYLAYGSIIPEVFYEYAIAGLVYWNATAGKGMAGKELHGYRMDSRTHQYNHDTYGARYASGMDITGLTDGGDTYTNISSGVFWDEDIKHEPALQTNAPFIYRLGTDGEWTSTTPDLNVSYNAGGSYDVWNENTGSTWQLTQGGALTDYWIIFLIVTPDLTGYSYKKVIGQNAYSTRAKARNAIASEKSQLAMDGLPSPEFVFLYAWITKRNGTLEDDGDGNVYYDLRPEKGGSGGSGGDASLAGDVVTDVTNFDTHLSSSDTTVQDALETIDDHTHTASQITDFDTEVANNSAVVANTAKISYTDATKVSGIETGADVTDATNVNAAGATMNNDTSLAGNGYFLDEDAMSSNSATKVASQQSVKAYIDAAILQAKTDMQIAVGDVHVSTVSTNPATSLGYGTWTSFGAGRVLVGLDSSDTDFDTSEETGGSKTHTLTTDEMPSHTHIQDSHNHLQNQHRHGLPVSGSTTAGYAGFFRSASGAETKYTNYTTPTNQATTATNQNTGGGSAHTILNPYIVVYMWKRTA